MYCKGSIQRADGKLALLEYAYSPRDYVSTESPKPFLQKRH